jgi:hypothetical protein
MTRRLIAAAVAAGLLLVPSAAAADPPAGDWTYVRKDHFKHYACKQDGKDGLTIKTATFLNGDDQAVGLGIGAYTTIARGSNKKLIDSRTSTAWRGGYVRTNLRGAENSDRLWMQGAYYGPAEPWSDGFAVRRLERC